MRIQDKLEEIENYLFEIESFMPQDFEDYKDDIKTKAACERYFEKIIESVVDLTFLIIKSKGYKIPEEDKKAFDMLVKEEVITLKLAEKLKDAKGMRNIITHEYGMVDDVVVFHSITKELVDDVKDLLKQIRAKNL